MTPRTRLKIQCALLWLMMLAGVIGVLLMPLLFAGCAAGPQGNPVQSVGVTAGQSGAGWAAGLTITFKATPPAWVRHELEQAGAVADGLVFTLPKLKTMDERQQRAVAAASAVGGVVKGNREMK